jgi:hypothetical protein
MGVDVIDYTYLQKRGLIKIKPIEEKSGVSKIDRQGYIELGSDALAETVSAEAVNSSFFDAPSSSAAQAVQGGLFGALDSAASSASSSLSSTSIVDNSLNQSVEEIKSKFGSFELSMQNLLQRIELLEYRIKDLERGLR